MPSSAVAGMVFLLSQELFQMVKPILNFPKFLFD